MIQHEPTKDSEQEKKILIVDDEPDVITYLATLFEDNGYRTDEANNAEEAMERVLADKPNLISLDIMMPKQSGIAFYRNLKLDERTRDVPVIFVSAFSNPQDFFGPRFRKLIPETTVPEPEAYVEKPIDIPKLLGVVQDVLG